jgi:uncharacterized membrane protein YiaA
VSAISRFALAVVLCLALVGLWLALTALTGKTYHLAPAIIALAPGLVVRADESAGETATSVALTLAIGPVAVAAGWVAIVAAGVRPHTTLFPDQPGGVATEVAVAAVAGLLAGWRLAMHRVRHR